MHQFILLTFLRLGGDAGVSCKAGSLVLGYKQRHERGTIHLA